MTRSAVHERPLAASWTQAAMKSVAIGLILLEFLDTILVWTPPPPVIVLASLAVVAMVTSLWKPGIGVALGIPVVATNHLFGSYGYPLLTIFVTMLVVTIRWRWSRVALVAVLHLLAISVEFLTVTWPARTAVMLMSLGAALLVGTIVRWLRAAVRRASHRITKLERQVAEVRRDERSALADELGTLLVDSFAHTCASLEQATSADAATMATLLERIGTDTRTSLTRLRRLVATLRDSPERRHRVTLLAAIEEAEDALVSRSHPVELVIDRVPELPTTQTALFAGGLRHAVDHVRTHSPAGATCTITLESTSGGTTLTVAHAQRGTPGPRAAPSAGLRHLRERFHAAGGELRVEPTDAWRLHLTLPPGTGPTADRRPGGGWAALASPGAVSWLRGLAGWLPRAAIVVLLGGLAAIVAAPLAPFVGPGLAGRDPTLLGVALMAVTAATRPSWAIVLIPGWALYVTAWGGGRLPIQDLSALFVGGVLAAFPGYLVHHFVTMRTTQKGQLEALATERAEVPARERRQLAGELHDIVAHQLSLMSLQALGVQGATDTDTLRGALARIAAINTSAESDLHTLVHIMRDDRGTGAPAASQSWLCPSSAVLGVSATLRDAGHEVDVQLSPDVDACDPTTQKTVSRILREATTNVLRYAPPGAPISIEAATTAMRVIVTVTNPLVGPTAPGPDSSGFGLIGLRERIALTGGQFGAGREGDVWAVRASLPRWATASGSLARRSGSGTQRWQRGRVHDPELDRTHQHLGA